MRLLAPQRTRPRYRHRGFVAAFRCRATDTQRRISDNKIQAGAITSSYRSQRAAFGSPGLGVLDVTATTPEAPYVLGETDLEHERLTRQAAILRPFTERLFRDAGIGPGMRVLDIGSGLGDVSILAAALVGPDGQVVGVERDVGTIRKAKTRVDLASLGNVTFLEADVGHIPDIGPFDAVVGRLILEFLPEPELVVRSLCALLRPGGLMVLQDACWGPWLSLNMHLPLRAKCATLIHQAFQRSGANMDMELVLYRSMKAAGMPAPRMRVDVPVGNDPDIANWVFDLFRTLRPRMRPEDLEDSSLGEFDSLSLRLETELSTSNSFGACIGLVGAWSGKPQ
jgi:SAM-dependent methyltransferase